MQKIRKVLCTALILVLALALCPCVASAAELIVPDKACTINLDYHFMPDGGPAVQIPNVKFSFYKIGTVDAYTRFTVAPKYAAYEVNFQELAEAGEWDTMASSYYNFVYGKVAPDVEGTTGMDGKVAITKDKSGADLTPGLYLMVGESCFFGDYQYVPKINIIMLPALNETENKWDYAPTVCPKVERRDAPPEFVERSVIKVWKDNGYESARPNQITVQLRRNGVDFGDPVILNAANNWRYTWEKLPGRDASGLAYTYTLTEKGVPSDYKVTVTETGTVFEVTNTYRVPTPPPGPPSGNLPQTGLLWWPVPLLACIGIIFLTAGALRRRKGC